MAKRKQDTSETAESGLSFEDSLEQLQQAVHELESGGLTLTDSLSRYESGVRHLRKCIKLLEQTDLRIRQLVAIDENGNAQLDDFEHSSTGDSNADESGETSNRASVRKGTGKTATHRRKKAEDTDEDCDNLF